MRAGNFPHAGKLLLANPQQLLPLSEVAFKAKALRNLKRRDQAALDVLISYPLETVEEALKF
jgi:hypothetical protein